MPTGIYPRMLPEERFWAKVNKTASCWLWLAARVSTGYGYFGISAERLVLAHRYAYELLVGPIPTGLEIDHLCRVRTCVNPLHLQAVTHIENVRRGRGGEWWAAKTHCPQGHPYSGRNLIQHHGSRFCRICHNLSSHKRKE